MPWSVLKRDCKQADGSSGKYVILKKKSDGSTEQVSCHTSEKKAKSAVSAKHMSEAQRDNKTMRITKRQLRRIVQEACGLETGASPEAALAPLLPDEPIDSLDMDPNVPVPEDYEKTRSMLDQNQELVDLGLDMVMDMAGTGCERSTAQGVIDHLQDLVDGGSSSESQEALPDPLLVDPMAGIGIQGL